MANSSQPKFFAKLQKSLFLATKALIVLKAKAAFTLSNFRDENASNTGIPLCLHRLQNIVTSIYLVVVALSKEARQEHEC